MKEHTLRRIDAQALEYLGVSEWQLHHFPKCGRISSFSPPSILVGGLLASPSLEPDSLSIWISVVGEISQSGGSRISRP